MWQKIKKLIKTLYYDKRVRFLFVGGLNTVVGVGVTWLVYLCFGVSIFSKEELVWYVYLTGTLTGQVVGTVHSYFWNKYFTFRSKERSAKEFLRFVLVYAVQYGINLGLTALLNKLVAIPALVTVVTTIVCTILSYVGHNFFSFRKRKAQEKLAEENGEGVPEGAPENEGSNKEKTFMDMKQKEEDKQRILDLAAEYCRKYHAPKEYHKGDRIHYAGRVFGEEEMRNLVSSSLDFWLTSGEYTDRFESEFGKFLGVKSVSLVNSGSSANLAAFMALTSPLLGDRAVRRGDEVITVAAGFPTTVAPIIQFGAVPVFVDITIPQYNIDTDMLEAALSEKTKAVMVAHTLGNPFDLAKVKAFCDRHSLWLIEDNCDALGSKYTIGGEEKYTGTIGDIGTSSFYPPHHITMGEGGAVYTNDAKLGRIVRSFRDWGRDCVCPSGMDNFCGHRFDRQYGELPLGYDHKYVYSHFGYNLKATDMQAAIGCAQLKRIDDFAQKRRANYKKLREGLEDLSGKLILPEICPSSNPSPFGFMLVCREGVNAFETVEKLEEMGVQTRRLFAGNLTKHPCFDEMRKTGEGYRIVGTLENTDIVMNRGFWIGVYPGMTDEMTDYMIECLHTILK